SLWFSFFFYFFPDTAPPETYTLSLHDALPISWAALPFWLQVVLYLVISDFLLYWIHRIFHGPRMWKYHAVHHSSEHVDWVSAARSEEHTSELQSRENLVCRLLLEKKKKKQR